MRFSMSPCVRCFSARKARKRSAMTMFDSSQRSEREQKRGNRQRLPAALAVEYFPRLPFELSASGRIRKRSRP